MPKSKAEKTEKTEKTAATKAKPKRPKKKADAAPPEIPEGASLDEVMAIVNRGRERPLLKRASEAANPFMLRRPFGLPSLDIAIGGGMPAGGAVQIGAKDSVGKSALANCAAAMNQRIYGKNSRILWVCFELPYDKPHGRINGVLVSSSETDIEHEQLERACRDLPPLTKTEIAERKKQIGEFIVADSDTAEARLDSIVRILAANVCQLIVVDSMAAITTKYRIDTDMDHDPRQMATAWLVSQFQQLCWHYYANPDTDELNWTTLIVLNQARAKKKRTNSIKERDWEISGAHAFRHGKLLDLMLTNGDRIDVDGPKGKAGCHEGGRGELAYYFAHGFDRYSDLVSTARRNGMVVKSGRTYDLITADKEVLAEGLTYGTGGVELARTFRKDPDLFQKTYLACLEAAEVSCLHKL